MPSRTQIVCLHEGKKGRSIDPIFIRTLLKTLDLAWIRAWTGNNIIRPIDCGGRNGNSVAALSSACARVAQIKAGWASKNSPKIAAAPPLMAE